MVKLPKLGTVVEITWRDSGLHAHRTGMLPGILSTQTMVDYGKLTAITADDITLTHTADPGGLPENESYAVIWRPSIVKVKAYR